MTTTPPSASAGPVRIRPCRATDLEPLERHMPSPGRTRRHAARFDRQEQGLSTFLTAWADDVPVGSAQILWQGCAAPEVRARFPDCPELNGLAIWPPELRSRGIGTALIHAAEQRVHDAGHALIGLGVDDDNHRAAALYLRIGYRETGCRYLDRYAFLDADGVRQEVADPARFLVKELDATAPGPT
ncbi:MULTISPECIES: GNAT family N-acetyltransferase [Streptomyces]|uniref:GNAT family N-acetyltransferase n=1 Tax=Streptomyces TaxID=1883 RepID=UPI00093B8255|nr:MULTISPECIES: GNAT family N-acetyltransferase [unclassified Streptomyces]OKJ06296.1 acetyltransferase [Streptomyces sp. TSRI0261]QNQ36050.1 GNAT family N-acetyltransferase [Streptomyces sp. CB00271]